MRPKTNDKDQNPHSDLVLENAKRLTDLYIQEKGRSVFKRTLEECLENERQKITELSVAYLPYFLMNGIKFLNGRYFKENKTFNRFQEIPEIYFNQNCKNYYFISHRWLNSTNPDPDGDQFVFIKTYFDNLKPEVQDSWGFWYDYSCLPQKDNSGTLSSAEEIKFQSALKLMHLLPMLSSTIMIYDVQYLNRAWCSMEWMCATKLSPILVENSIPIPFFNAIKFRHLALLSLFLIKDDDFKSSFIAGDDAKAIPHLNSLIYKSLMSCSSTIENDKNLIVSMMYEHFWNHLQLLGFRTQLMTAFLLLERLDEETIKSLFIQFIAISEDANLSWTNENMFILESLFNGIGTPTDMIFHRGEIQPKSNSSSDFHK